ncbi:hypothetical protein HYS82_03740, partial [Candidatus Amesbacteria bacterium]|nr:hypothetical protein [Candidatus Amesbacteria bacterium]
MKKYLLIAILILATTLRFYKISSYPAGLNADEAALGYNAYSLLLTGHDEHGHVLPVNLESFGDFKPAGYTYLLIPVIKFFGLTEFAVRLPSALFGVIAVYLIYNLTKYLTSNPSPGQRHEQRENLGEGNERGEVLGLLSALALAISPWHLHFSRGAWEVNTSTTLLLLGVLSFVKWLKNKSLVNFALCTLHFALSMYFYQSTRVIAPLLGLGLFIIYFKTLIKYPKQIILNTLLLLLLLLPLAISIVSSNSASRLSGVGLLADEGPLNRVKEMRGQHTSAFWLSKLLHNRPVIYSIQFIQNYLSHFDGNFLFVSGDFIERNRVPETGLLYLTDFIFLFIGLIFLIRNSSFLNRIMWLWLFIAPAASALTFQVPHALRAQNLVIPMIILVSAGGYSLKETPLRSPRLKRTVLFILAGVYMWQFVRYLHQYYIHYPQTYPTAWEYGFKELVSFVESNQDRYDRIWVTDRYDQPYILFLFYLKYPPQLFQGRHQLTLRDKFNFSTVRDFGKYHFESSPWAKVRDIHSTLIVAAP